MLDLSWLYIPFAVILMVGYSNAVNLTDGLDGLAIGLVIMVGLALTVLAYLTGRVDFAEYLQIPFIKGAGEIAVFCLAVVGASVGFLWFNAHPADVWMGDTGAFPWAACSASWPSSSRRRSSSSSLAGCSCWRPLSVAIQVISFKLTGKARLQDGAAAPPLRAQRVAGEQGGGPAVDPRRPVRDPGPFDAEDPVGEAEMERVEKERGDMVLVMLMIVILGVGIALLFSASYPSRAARTRTPCSS